MTPLNPSLLAVALLVALPLLAPAVGADHTIPYCTRPLIGGTLERAEAVPGTLTGGDPAGGAAGLALGQVTAALVYAHCLA